MAKLKKPLKILLIHGLESSPGGTKHRFLQRIYENVKCPQMHMSILKLNKKNSIIRNILRNTTFRFCCGISLFGLVGALSGLGIQVNLSNKNN